MQIFKAGDIVRHFKYETLSEEERLESKYLYKIIGFAEDAETGESVVVYQALYPEGKSLIYKLYVRPYKDFISEVDHEKYPNIRQKYRFELIGIRELECERFGAYVQTKI